MDWRDRADRFWAAELGVAPRLLRTDGFHPCERPDAALRAVIVSTSSATVVSLPAERAFEHAGLSLEEMRRAPRRYMASCTSTESLDVRGPAHLAYWPPSSWPPVPRGQIEPIGGDALNVLQDVAPAEWDEAGIGRPDSRVFGLRVDDRIVAVAAYARWSGQIAQLRVFTQPAYRRRGLAAQPLAAAISAALADDLLPQYRARDDNAASVALAKGMGFVEYGWMATVRIRSLRARAPDEADWPSILALANESVAGVPGAGPQDEWLGNRRSFDSLRHQLVVHASGSLVGYGAAESRDSGSFRLFIVCAPAARETVGAHLYAALESWLQTQGATDVWFQEYATDTELIAFARRRGFSERRRFEYDGTEIVVLGKP